MADVDKIKEAQIELEKKAAANAVEEYKAKIIEQRRADRMAQLEEYRKEKIDDKDEKGNPVTHWHVWERKINQSLKESAFTSNYDWRTYMMMLLGDLSLMVTAMNGSVKTSDIVHGMRMLWDKKCPVLFGLPDTANIPLPNLEYGVKVTDAAGGHKLVIDPLIRTNTADFSQEFVERQEIKSAINKVNNAFKVPVLAWLESHGYKPSPADPEQFIRVNEEGDAEVLTQERFNELNSNPGNDLLSLDDFLRDKTDVSLTPRP